MKVKVSIEELIDIIDNKMNYSYPSDHVGYICDNVNTDLPLKRRLIEGKDDYIDWFKRSVIVGKEEETVHLIQIMMCRNSIVEQSCIGCCFDNRSGCYLSNICFDGSKFAEVIAKIFKFRKNTPHSGFNLNIAKGE